MAEVSTGTQSDVATSSSLATNFQQLLTEAKANRVKIQKKWVRNYAAANCDENFDPDTWKEQESKKKKSWKSDSYLDVTRQKCTAFVSLAQDALFKGGRVPFMLDPDMRSPSIAEADPLVIEGAIDANQDLIHRQHAGTNATMHMTRCLLSGAVYGEWYAKSYTTDLVEEYYAEPYPNLMVKQVRRTPTKAMEQKSVWNIWWERESGDIRKAEYVFERTMCNAMDLRREGKNPHALPEKVKGVLEKQSSQRTRTTTNPADTATLPPGTRSVPYRTRSLERYEGWLWVPRKAAEDFEASNPSVAYQPTEDEATRQDQPQTTDGAGILSAGNDDTDLVYVYAVYVDGEIIAYKREPGDHPYFGDFFEESIDGLYGRGIADNMESWQKSLNGAVRSFENNTKLIANFIVAVKRRLLQNRLEDQIDEGGVLEVSEECDDARKAVQQLTFVDITGPLMKAIEMFMEFSDLASNLPRAQQGQQSDNPQTLGEFNERIAKSGKYVGQIITRFDRLIAWDAQNRYDYNAGDPDSEVPKIPASVKALGFTSFDNRYMRVQRLIQMLTMALNDRTGELLKLTKIRWLWEEIGKSQDLEAAQFIKSPEEQAAEQAPPEATAEAQPEQDPLTEVSAQEKAARAEHLAAQAEATRTDTALKQAQFKNQIDAQRLRAGLVNRNPTAVPTQGAAA